MFYRFLACAILFVIVKGYGWWGAQVPSSVLNPGKFVRNFISFESNRALPYTDIQILLEDVGEEYGLFNGTKGEDKKILARLFQNETVKELLRRCRTFRKKRKCSSKDVYRTPDGSCNNLKNPYWGAADGPMVRWLPANYVGIREFKRRGVLPAPREISLKLDTGDNPSKKISAFFTFFGQFIAHDISLSPIKWAENDIPCCETRYRNDEYCRCNIYVKHDDPFFSKFNITCMRFRRTAPYPQCNFRKRTQINKNSAFLDTNIVYGNNESYAKHLRTKDGSGKLVMQLNQDVYILPANVNNETVFCPINETTNCFASGDDRVNQHVMLSSLHTMYLRFHNKIAENLKKLNPHWDGDKIYHESRRVMGALYQNMVYKEYLPLLIGMKHMLDHDLFVYRHSWYDKGVKPFAMVESTTAAFRLHSMVPKVISKYSPKTYMRNTFAYTEPVHRGKWSKLVAGSCELPTQKNDRFLVRDLNAYLYSPPGAQFGFELTAINIQRGRDHGLPPYVEVAKKCSGLKIKKFSDLDKLMPYKNYKLLEKIYKKLKDIDLWIGILMETPVKGGQVGPTAACILSMQFYRLKHGDAFFFTHKNGRHPFSKTQTQCIREYTVSRFLCDTIDYHEVRVNPFLLPSKWNPMISCKKSPKLDLSPWKEYDHQEM